MQKLPPPQTTGPMSLEETINRRRSVRSFSTAPLTDAELSQLLHAAQGVTDRQRGRRAVPSAGATFPLEVYLVRADGVHHYDPRAHTLEQLAGADKREELAQAAHGQSCVRNAPVALVLSGVEERTAARYGNRARRYLFMEAGHAAQNIHLQAVALGLGAVPVGAFDDDAVARVLELNPKKEIPLYIIPVGHPAPSSADD